MKAGSSLSPGCYIGCSGGITIGEKTMVGPGVRLFAENHSMGDTSVSVKDQGVEWGEIVIGDGCWIASGVTVTAGVTIGDGAVIAAGAVVTRDVPAFGVYGGIPARPLPTAKKQS
ncbi:MAG TPA: acyltransferase [Candidatus Agrococcus pullicola]|uniref:Acyltransferase n=1 Tax=Candidatus Agrococcus pullicola TaxID=2838429 RepID=A0A9D1YU98_9MICO|nr:acyltransferase [Candidatus Agrococcus pullicola]